MEPLSELEAAALDGPDATLASIALSLGRRAVLPALAAELVFGGLARAFATSIDWHLALVRPLVVGASAGLVVALVAVGPLAALAIARRFERPSLLATMKRAFARLPVLAAAMAAPLAALLVAVAVISTDDSHELNVVVILVAFFVAAVAFFGTAIFGPPLFAGIVLGERPTSELRVTPGVFSTIPVALGVFALSIPAQLPLHVPDRVLAGTRTAGLVALGAAWLLALAAMHHRAGRPAAVESKA